MEVTLHKDNFHLCAYCHSANFIRMNPCCATNGSGLIFEKVPGLFNCKVLYAIGCHGPIALNIIYIVILSLLSVMLMQLCMHDAHVCQA